MPCLYFDSWAAPRWRRSCWRPRRGASCLLTCCRSSRQGWWPWSLVPLRATSRCSRSYRCVRIYLSISLSLSMYIYIRINYIHINVFIYVYMCVCVHICIYIYICVYIYMYIYVYMHIYVYICVCI